MQIGERIALAKASKHEGRRKRRKRRRGRFANRHHLRREKPNRLSRERKFPKRKRDNGRELYTENGHGKKGRKEDSHAYRRGRMKKTKRNWKKRRKKKKALVYARKEKGKERVRQTSPPEEEGTDKRAED